MNKSDPQWKPAGDFQLTVFPSQGVGDEEDGVARPYDFAGRDWTSASLDQTPVKAPLMHLSRLATQAVMRSGVGRIGSPKLEGR